MNFYTVHNENGTLALPLTPSLCLPPFAMGGNDKLEIWKGKKIKSFIVQYDHLYPGVYGGDDHDDALICFCCASHAMMLHSLQRR